MVALVKGTFKIMMWNKLKVACAWSVPIILVAGATPLAINLTSDNFKPIQVQLGWLSSGVNTFYSEREVATTSGSTNSLPGRLTVGHRPLKATRMVRIHSRQPITAR